MFLGCLQGASGRQRVGQRILGTQPSRIYEAIIVPYQDIGSLTVRAVNELIWTVTSEPVSDRGRAVRSRGEQPPTRGAPKHRR
jgi:hypothetical protein